jgi:hypothetical protein
MSNVRPLPDGDTITAQMIELFDTIFPGHIPPPRPYWAEQEGRKPPAHDEQLLADHHVATLAFARKALGASPTLTDTLLLVCNAWPDQAEAEAWRKVIAIEDYMSARDEITQAATARDARASLNEVPA